MKIENCWKLKLLKFLQVLLMVSVIFSDIIFRFAVDCISGIFRHHFLRNESNFPARCRLYAAAVISLQFIVTIFIIILYYYIYIYRYIIYIYIIYIYIYIHIHIYIYIYILYRKVSVFTLLNIVQIELQHPVRIQWCYGFANGSLVNIISMIFITRSIALI